MVDQSANILDRITRYFKGIENLVGTEKLATSLRLSKRELNQLYNGELDLCIVDGCIRRTGGSFARLFNGDELDYVCGAAKVLGSTSYAPNKYRKGAYSKRQITRNILDLLEANNGKPIVEELLLHFQLSKDFFSIDKLDMPISTLLNKEILSYLVDKHVDVFTIGQQLMCKTQELGGRVLSGLTEKQMYEKVVEEVVSKVDQSHDYQIIKLTDRSVRYRKQFSEQMLDYHKGKVPFIPGEEQYIIGCGTAVPLLELGRTTIPSIKFIEPGVMDMQYHFCGS